jgi:undecaprenyl-diphosphatase
MDPKPSPVWKLLPTEILRDLITIVPLLLSGAWQNLIKARWIVLSVLAIITVLIVSLWSQDAAFIRDWATPQQDGPLQIARRISFWGDYPTGILLSCLLLWLAGFVLNQTNWRQLALACLLGSALAGLNANLISFNVGRPRPSAEMTDGFYGFHTTMKYRSFPSGHAATGFGMATVLAVACPPLALPAGTTALAICWSRLYLHRHYVTDLILGSTLGLIWGGAVGLTYRRLLKK